jgi:hypothetical protein
MDDNVPVRFVPGRQFGEALLVLGVPYFVRHRIPDLPARTGFVAEEDRQIGVIRASLLAQAFTIARTLRFTQLASAPDPEQTFLTVVKNHCSSFHSIKLQSV